MSSAAGPSIATSGLVLDFDMNNTQKSWLGAPTTNMLTYSESANTVYNLSSGSFVPDAVLSPTGTMTADRINLTAGAMNSWDVYRQVSVTSGVVYTFSMYVLLGSSTNFCVVVNNTQAWDTVARQCFTSANGLNSSNWTRISLTFTGPAFGAINIHLGANYESALSASPQSGGYAYMWGTQLEVGSFATPYIPTVASTVARSTTQAVLDLTNNNTLTANSLTYASDNTFSFNGTSDYIACGNLGTFYPQGTVSFWMNATTIASYPNPFATHFQGSNVGFRFEGRADGNFNMVVGNDAGTYTPHTFIASGMAANTWYNITFTWIVGSNIVAGYLNGVQVFNEAQTYWATTMPSVTIGNGFSAARYWNGKISATQIYNRALSAAEVALNFNATAGRYRSTIGSHPSYPAPSGYYLAQNYPTFGSGYYWIQSSSMPNPLLMYVDMSEEGGGYDFYAIAGTGISVNYTNITNSGTALGLDLVYPRSKYHWRAMSNYVKNVLGLTGAGYSNYFQTTYGVRSASAGGNYTNVIMRNPTNYGTGSSAHSVADGGRWWLRDTIFTEPNGDYPAYGTFGGYAFPEPYALTDMQFNDISASYPTGAYYLVSTNAKP